MKRILFIAMAVCLIALGSMAQQPPTEYDAIGSIYSFAALDTVHSSFTKASGVAAAKWFGPRIIQVPKLFDIADPSSRNGDWATIKAMPSGWFLYANEPFTLKALYVNGDSTGIAAVSVDTMSVTAIQAASSTGFRDAFPCRYHLKAAVTQLRVNTASGDTVLGVPLYSVKY